MQRHAFGHGTYVSPRCATGRGSAPASASLDSHSILGEPLGVAELLHRPFRCKLVTEEDH
jgi:hypothetical protein